MTDTLLGRIKEAMGGFHRNSCYPDAMDHELDIGVRAVLAAIAGSLRWEGDDVRSSCFFSTASVGNVWRLHGYTTTFGGRFISLADARKAVEAKFLAGMMGETK